MDQSYYGVFQKWEIAVAKKVVFEFQKDWSCLKSEDFDDLLQECFIHWLFVKEQFEQEEIKSMKSLMGKVMRNKLRDYVRNVNQQKRKVRYHSISLFSSQSNAEDSLHLEDKLSTETDNPNGLTMDLEMALLKLTKRQEKICRLLEADFNISEIARFLNVRRETVYSDLKKIQKVFKQNDLDIYLEGN